MIVIPSERMNLVLNGETISFKPVLGLGDKIVMSDWLVRYRKLACFLVGLVAVGNRRSGNSFDCIEIYKSAIASADAKVYFRGGGVF
jgi:hypothetical protein